MKLKITLLGLLLIVLAGSYLSIRFYSYVFARDVSGEVIGIERVTAPEAIITGGAIAPSQIFSFAVAVRDASGEIATASSEDRQWAVVQKGQCVEAKFLRYPPWNLQKAGTFFGARLLKLYDCPKPTPAPSP